MKYDYLLSISYTIVAGGANNSGRILYEMDHKLNRNDVEKIEFWFKEKHNLFSCVMIGACPLDPIPDRKDEPDGVLICTL